MPTMISRFRRAVQSPTLRNTGWSALGSVTNGVLGAVSSAILARVLGVEDFGAYILILALINFVTDLSDLGLSSSIIKFGSPAVDRNDYQRFRDVVSAVLRMKLIFGAVVTGLALLFLQPLVSLIFHHVDPEIEHYFRLALVAAACAVPALIFPSVLQAKREFRTSSLVMTSRYISKLALLLTALALVSVWDLELVVWIETGSVIIFLATGYAVSPFKRFGLGKGDPELRREILGFGKWISLFQIVSLFGGKLDIFFVGGISDAGALGLYGAAMKIAGVVSVTTYSYFTALVPEFSGMTSAKAVLEHRRKSWFVGAVLTSGILLLGLVAHPIVILLYGDQFSGAAPLLQVICIGLVLNVIAHPYSATMFARNRPQVFPVSSAVAMAVFAVANLLLIPVIGVMGAAVAYALQSAALLATVLIYYARWKRNLPAEERSL